MLIVASVQEKPVELLRWRIRMPYSTCLNLLRCCRSSWGSRMPNLRSCFKSSNVRNLSTPCQSMRKISRFLAWKERKSSSKKVRWAVSTPKLRLTGVNSLSYQKLKGSLVILRSRSTRSCNKALIHCKRIKCQKWYSLIRCKIGRRPRRSTVKSRKLLTYLT